ncbi:MAG: hypothetical protein KGI58_01330 [Patescibacteria group bacterium]|nr:hypothetical protein [Patescibacteria group bacterium]
MDIKELNKTQLILLTLLITFVVSVATGIVTVSLMQKMPKSVPQTINNVIQRTIEKVTTIPAPITNNNSTPPDTKSTLPFGDGNVVVSIYPADEVTIPTDTTTTTSTDSTTTKTSANTDSKNVTDTTKTTIEKPKALGKGIIISDVGLILVDSTILTDKDLYKVILNNVDFDATVIERFSNGFAILKISQKNTNPTQTPVVNPATGNTTTPAVDNNQ